MASEAATQHILITDASTGIGRACALRLAREGFSVWAGVRNAADGNTLTQAAAYMRHGIRALQIDVTDINSIQSAEKEIRSQAGAEGLFGLINNAGNCIVGPVEFVSLADWRQQFEVNLFGTIAVTQAMLPLFRLHQSFRSLWRDRQPSTSRATSTLTSRIINIGSITGEVSTALFAASSASKFALRATNDALRLELRFQGIRSP
jgi:NAD(P)-dependent dehydrogenase (short-subunit alcohol dehydrogenase family)